MKKQLQFLTLFFMTLFATAQVQVGNDIDGVLAGDNLGKSVSISSDGSIMAVGSPGNDAGYVRVYKKQGSTWAQIGGDIVGASNDDGFGTSVSLSADGSIVAIGSPENTLDYVRVYQNIGNAWVQIGSDIDGGNSGYSFGKAVSLNADGSVLAIGAPDYYDDNFYNFYGLVRIYKNQAGTWVQVGSDLIGDNDGDEFGTSVSLSADGSILAIGAPAAEDENGMPTGLARIYKNQSGTWTKIGDDIDNSNDVNFESDTGYSVSLSADGTVLAVGERVASSDDYTYAGQVRVFNYASNAWTQLGNTLKGTQDSEYFGDAVSLSADGTVVGVGSYGYDLDSNTNKVGKAQVFKIQNNTWIQIENTIVGENANDFLGAAVSINGDGTLLAVGIPNFDNNKGKVRVYNFNTPLEIQNNTFANVSIYPNPSNNYSKIQLGRKYNNVTVQVFNVLGKLMLTQQYTNTDNISLNTQKFATGLYTVKVQSDSKIARLKLIVN